MATVTISHTRADGTLLDGSVKGDGVFDVVRHHGFRSFRSLGMLGIPRSRDKEAQTWRINSAAAALREAGHEVTVEINEDERRSFAEAEAERVERAEGRAERYAGYADNAAISSNARHAAAHQIAGRFEFGQPILVGHHSERRARRDAERIDTNMRSAIEDGKRAGYWQSRTEAAEHYEQHRNDPYRTMRRLEKLNADLRSVERHHGDAIEASSPSADRHARLIRDLKEEIEYWEEVVAKAEADGVKIWRPEDFAAGDFVLCRGSWYQIARVNPKTLSIAWNLRLAPKQVMTLEDATDNGRVWTHTFDYSNARARCPEEAMRAFLADGKVPGTKSAREASAAAPADAIRAAQKAKPKKRAKRSDPKVPKKVRVDCRWDATEATLTWLNGNGQPHPDHPAETLHAPEGQQFTEAAGSRALLSQVTEKLAERGLTYRGRWNGGPRSLVCSIAPDPAREPKQEELS